MSPKRILVVTGSRADYGLLRPVLAGLEAEDRIDPVLVVAGSHLLGRNPTIDEIRAERAIHEVVQMQVPGACTREADARAVARGIEGFADLLGRSQVDLDLDLDLVLVLGDRIEAFAAAVAASLMGRHVAHIHGGDAASGVADESLRHAVTKLAHVHFPATELSAGRIRRMGEHENSIHVVGSPAVDGLDRIEPLPDEDWSRLGEPRFAVLLHPTGADDETERARAASLISEVSGRGRTILFEPNLDPGREGILEAMDESGLDAVDHLDRTSFVGLLRRVDVLVGNSSAGLLECATLGVAAVDVGTRQAGREVPSTAVHVEAFSGERLGAALDEAIAMHKAMPDKRFGDGRAGERIARSLACLDLSSVPVRKCWVD